MQDTRAQPRLYFKLLVSTAAAIILLGVLVIISWFLNITTLEGRLSNYIVMKFNTALCFIAAGFSFWLIVKYQAGKSKILYSLLSACFGLFALLIFSQYVLGWNAGVDQLFITDHHSVKLGMPSPGRMSPSTAVSFILMALSFLLINAQKRYYRVVAQYMLHAVTIIAFISLLGYILKVPYSLKFEFFSLMGINTAAGFIFFSSVATTVNPTLGVTGLFTGKQVGDIIARKLFPRMAVILIIVSYFSLEMQRDAVISSEFGLVLTTTAFLLIALYLIWDTLTEMNRLDVARKENELKSTNERPTVHKTAD